MLFSNVLRALLHWLNPTTAHKAYSLIIWGVCLVHSSLVNSSWLVYSRIRCSGSRKCCFSSQSICSLKWGCLQVLDSSDSIDLPEVHKDLTLLPALRAKVAGIPCWILWDSWLVAQFFFFFSSLVFVVCLFLFYIIYLFVCIVRHPESLWKKGNLTNRPLL